MEKVVLPDLIRHPFLFWIPAIAGKTGLAFIVAGVIRKAESADAAFLD
jgi:hypothetical protein